MAYSLEKINYEFSRVSTADALEIRKIMMNGVAIMQKGLKDKCVKGAKINNDDLSDEIATMNNLLAEIEPFALKYLVIINPDGSKIERPETSMLEQFFENPFYALEISKTFFEMIQGFLDRLPSSQNTQKA